MTAGSLSVIMPNYNHAHYIGEALQAILSQSFRPTEVIVVDDGSTDDSVAVIEQFAKHDPIVRLVRNDRNRGVVFSENRGLDIALGDYVYGASADDRVLPGFFEKSMSLLARYPQAGLCCSDMVSFDDRTGVVYEVRFHLSDEPCYFSPDELVELARRMSYAPIDSNTCIVKRSALVSAGGFMTELRWSADWFAMRVIGFRHGICYVPEILAARRILQNSFSASGRRQPQARREIVENALRLLKTPAYSDVFPLFKESTVLGNFHSEDIVRVILSNPQHWNHFLPVVFLPAVWLPLWHKIRRLWHRVLGWLAVVTPAPLKRLRRRVFKLVSLS